MEYCNMIIVKVGELHLKGQNRPFFERTMIHNIKLALKGFAGLKVTISQSRIFVYNIPPQRLEEALEILSRIFGIHALSPAREIEKNLDTIISNAVDMLKRHAVPIRLSRWNRPKSARQ